MCQEIPDRKYTLDYKEDHAGRRQISFSVIEPDKVKTTRYAGSLIQPYKGLLLAAPQGALSFRSSRCTDYLANL